MQKRQPQWLSLPDRLVEDQVNLLADVILRESVDNQPAQQKNQAVVVVNNNLLFYSLF